MNCAVFYTSMFWCGFAHCSQPAITYWKNQLYIKRKPSNCLFFIGVLHSRRANDMASVVCALCSLCRDKRRVCCYTCLYKIVIRKYRNSKEKSLLMMNYQLGAGKTYQFNETAKIMRQVINPLRSLSL